MTCAYNKLYLASAQSVLGGMLHYAVYDLKWDLKDFYHAFINSGISKRFGTGEPRYTVGMSGIELAREVVSIVTAEYPEVEPSDFFSRSPEYWAGFSVAYYEWSRDIPFDRIEKAVSITEITEMYTPYHEADITKLAIELDRLIDMRRDKSALARMRAYAGLTQKALAERSGVSARMIEQYEQGRKDLSHASAAAIYQLAHALNCSMEELITDSVV